MKESKLPAKKMRFFQFLWFSVLFSLLWAACAEQSSNDQKDHSTPDTSYRSSTIPPQITSTILPSPKTVLPEAVTQIPTQFQLQNQTPEEMSFKLCSPIADTQIESLTDLIVNPYDPPPPGSDAPHQGIDLAILRPGSDMALSGRPVQAVLSGTVAGVINQRFPYGNALIIETPLSFLPETWLNTLDFPKLQPTHSAIPALTCPEAGLQPTWDAGSRSIYLLYAHLLEPPKFDIGDTIHCGDSLGKIGDSGNAINPHLHLEMRIGPGRAQFDSMAHYENSATQTEMQAYCLWRVSGLFQVMDPGRLFRIIP